MGIPRDKKTSGGKRGRRTSAVVTNCRPVVAAASRRSFFKPTRRTGITGPQIDRTSSFHLTETFSSESGVSREKAMRMTWDLA